MNAKPLSALRVLLAEDHEPTNYALRKYLAALGHTILDGVTTGRQLVERCLALRPDLVIADVRLPDLDGIAAAEAVYREAAVPFVLASAYDDPDLVQRASECPAVMAYLIKPLEPADLRTAIAVALKRHEQFLAMRQEAAGLRQALEDRKVIERAKGVLMKWADLDEEEAFRRLQRLATTKNLKLVAAANIVLDAEAAFRP